MTGSLTSEQKARYEDEGFLVLEDFLSESDMAPAREVGASLSA